MLAWCMTNPIYGDHVDFVWVCDVPIYGEPCGFCLTLSICDGSDALAKKKVVCEVNSDFTPSFRNEKCFYSITNTLMENWVNLSAKRGLTGIEPETSYLWLAFPTTRPTTRLWCTGFLSIWYGKEMEMCHLGSEEASATYCSTW
jgi:hypothetical protein